METYEKLKEIYKDIDRLEKEKRIYFVNMFQKAPEFVFKNLEFRKIPKNVNFIQEYVPSNSIFFLLEGTVRTMEYRILGMQFDFMRFRAPQLFGVMEVLLDMEAYATSLVTTTDCTFLVLDKDAYSRWLDMDPGMLRTQSKNLLKLLFEQGRKERLLSFLQGRERLMLIFMEEYEVSRDANGKCRIKWTQNRMSVSSGLSVRTISRVVTQMAEDGFINYQRGNIRISEQQYTKMKAHLDQIIAK